MTVACLNTLGTAASDKDKLTIFVIIGARVPMHFLSKEVGIGSRSQHLSLESRTSLIISSTVAGAKSDKLSDGKLGLGI
jgi:hypothetical protein